jgi:flagellar protein FlaG
LHLSVQAAQEGYGMSIRSISGNERQLIMPGVEEAFPARQKPPPSVARAESSPPAQKAEKAETQQPSPDRESVHDLSRMLNEVIESLNWNIRIRVDDDTDRIVTQIIDPDKNEIIKQIPPQELLEIMSRLRNIVGLLLDIEI